MKYSITRHPETAFIPFSVTITCETEAEATAFHNVVAIKLAQPGPFIGACYSAIYGKRSPAFSDAGEIAMKPIETK